MPGASLRLVIITPEKPVLGRAVDSVALPAWDGEMGVLPGHAAALVQLREGILRYKDGGDTGVFAVMGGFAEVFRDEVAVFAEAAELAEEIDGEKVRQDVEKAKNALASRHPDMDIDAAEAALKVALLRLKAKTALPRRRERRG